MLNPELTSALENFCEVFSTLPDDKLDIPWHWKGYDEGIRFATFLTLLELQTIAVKLADYRPSPQPVQRILSQYHAAYLDLQASIFGVSPQEADRAPSDKDWPVHRVLAHIVGAEIGFSAVVRFALEGHRAGKWSPNPMTEADQTRISGMTEAEYMALMKGPYKELRAFQRDMHEKLLGEFATISATELDLPSRFWEEEHFPIHYRLHRFEAHTRQHTIQIDKTLSAIGLAPTEGKRLIRMLYNALAEVNGALIGTENTMSSERLELANTIVARTSELKSILSQQG